MFEPKYILNPDHQIVEHVEAAKERKKELFGEEYCPCVLPRFYGKDTICPCKDYREKGICICRLYIG